jgi:AGZA family xanthine/uracil permease-like MFS transporter
MEKFFKLKENGTKFSTEVIAGLTTFFAMAYIIAVNPQILSSTGMPGGAVFLATIIAAVIGTLIMGLFANVPYALAPGMGLNAFFTFTVVTGLHFSWQEAMAMVFICGILNIILTVTKLRKMIIRSLPPALQAAIGGGIGLFVIMVALCNVGIIKFTGGEGVAANGEPSLSMMNEPTIWLFLVGMVVTIFFVVFKFKGKAKFINNAGLFISIIIVALIGIPMGVTSMGNSIGIGEAFSQLPSTVGAIFTPAGFPALFSDPAKLPIVLTTILAFSLTDIFDTIGTFLGTGRKAGIFSDHDIVELESGKGFSSKMDKALFADATATSIGSLLGTSNTTTYVESSAGIAAGGRTGLTSVVVAVCFALSFLAAPLFTAIPGAATAPVLVIVGCMMLSSFKEIEWHDLAQAIPAFFASAFMAFTYSISYGIAFGFITFCLVQLFKGQGKKVHPIIWGVSALFIVSFTLMAIYG